MKAKAAATLRTQLLDVLAALEFAEAQPAGSDEQRAAIRLTWNSIAPLEETMSELGEVFDAYYNGHPSLRCPVGSKEEKRLSREFGALLHKWNIWAERAFAKARRAA